MVASQGHGALETPDGKIWNFMESEISGPPLNDDSYSPAHENHAARNVEVRNL
jgi:hypothetical protein